MNQLFLFKENAHYSPKLFLREILYIKTKNI
jgi:hypothetical protein